MRTPSLDAGTQPVELDLQRLTGVVDQTVTSGHTPLVKFDLHTAVSDGTVILNRVSDVIDGMLSRLDYPVFVVTTVDRAGNEQAGCLVGFLTQCSIDPVRFLACLSIHNHTYRVARRATLLAVHLVDRAQRDLAELFATTTGDEVDKFSRCAWRPGPGRVPLLTAASSWFVGTILDRFDLGDHVGFLLSPTEGGSAGEQPPLMFSAVRDFRPGHPA